MADSETRNDIVDPEKVSLVGGLPILKVVPTAPEEPNKIVNPFNSPNVQSSKRERGSSFKQILAAFAAQLGTVNTGLVFGFSAIAIPQMKAVGSPMNITKDEESWLASINAIGTPIGCLFSGYMADILGRKMTLIATEVPTLFGWLLIAFATDMRMIYAGRFFTGLGSGMIGAPARVYAAEVTQPHLRGMAVAMASVGVSTGVLIEYLLGMCLDWWWVAALSTLVPLASLILMFLFPETPSYLMSRNRPDKAKRALKRLRGGSCNVDKEMDVLVNFKNTHHTERLTGLRETLRAVFDPKAIKPFVILAIYFLLYQWSGTNALTFNAVKIFEESGSTIDGFVLTSILGGVRLVFTVVACILCRRLGRRPLTFLSSIGCGLSMLGLGCYKLPVVMEAIGKTHAWFPVLCIFSYTIFCTLGFLVIPWVMIGEVYPVQVRGIVGGMTTMIAHLSVFMVVKSYLSLQAALTDPGIYILYGVVPLVGTLYLYKYLPETKGRTLQEIEDYFSGITSTLGGEKSSSPPASAAVPLTSKPIVLDQKNGQFLP